MKTHRMIATTNPTDAQVALVFNLLCGALASVVARGASFDAVHAGRVADLQVFVRQHHAERGLARLGEVGRP